MRRVAWLGAVAALLLAPPAAGDECGRAEVLRTIPIDGTTDVPTNADLVAHYAPSAEYLDEPVEFEQVGGELRTLTPSFEPAESLLRLSVAPLEPNTDYVVRWPRLRGIGTAPTGAARTVEFRTGSGPDEEPPEFAGLEHVWWDVVHDTDECTDRSVERYRFYFEFPPARDDGGLGSLTLLIFQTRGPELTEPKQIDLRNFPADGEASLVQTVDATLGEVCFAAVARDATAKTSNSGSQEVCVHTVEPPVFYGCAQNPRRPGLHGLGLALGVALLVGWRRRWRRR